MRRTTALGILLAALSLAAPAPPPAGAETKTITLPPDSAYADLRPGAGMEIAQRDCRGCHSTDYIVMQPRGDAKQWSGVVTKMMKVYGANISEADAKAIVEYLSSAYGR
jgi:cytochrome c5